MQLTKTYQFTTSRERAFAAINDPELLRRCVAGCEKMVKTGENTYDAHVSIRSGLFHGNVVVRVEWNDVNTPETVTLHLEGGATPGRIKATAQVRLADKMDDCELRCELHLEAGGMIALMGTRRMEAAATKALDQFFDNIKVELGNWKQSPGTQATGESPKSVAEAGLKITPP